MPITCPVCPTTSRGPLAAAVLIRHWPIVLVKWPGIRTTDSGQSNESAPTEARDRPNAMPVVALWVLPRSKMPPGELVGELGRAVDAALSLLLPKPYGSLTTSGDVTSLHLVSRWAHHNDRAASGQRLKSVSKVIGTVVLITTDNGSGVVEETALSSDWPLGCTVA
jgi:hypothetical protein